MAMNLRIALSVGFRVGNAGDDLETVTLVCRGLVFSLPLTGVDGEDVEGDMRKWRGEERAYYID
jgi:hypothetical protein